MRRFLSFSRVQESSADQSALDEFNTAQMNPEGFLTFMQQLETQELLPASQQAEYARSHPISRNRIDAIRGNVENRPMPERPSRPNGMNSISVFWPS